MRSPSTGNPMRLVEGEPATYYLRGQPFEVDGPTWECPDTGKRHTTPEQDGGFLRHLHQLWRTR